MEIDGDESNGDVLFRIVYEDGDSEDMNEVECRPCIELHRKLESGEINGWEIGGDEWTISVPWSLGVVLGGMKYVLTLFITSSLI